MTEGWEPKNGVPEGWITVQRWELESFLEPVFQRFAFGLLGAGLIIFAVPYWLIHRTVTVGWLDLLLVVPTLVVMTLLHELAHALAILVLGGRPQLGIAWVEGAPVPYATGNWVTGRWAFAAFALAPAVLLTAGGIYAMLWVEPVLARQLYLFLAFNLSGAAADLLMAQRALQAPHGSRVHESKERTAIYAPPAN